MAHITTDLEALLDTGPETLDALLALLARLDRWPVLHTSTSPDALEQARLARESLTQEVTAEAVPNERAGRWRVSWHSRSWVLHGDVYADRSERWSAVLDPASPVVLIDRALDRVVTGPEVTQLATLALGQALVARWVRGMREAPGQG